MTNIKFMISDELSQCELTRRLLILNILSSKRLLIDHTEVLEESLDNSNLLDNVNTELFTCMKTTGLLGCIATVAIHCGSSAKKLLALLSIPIALPYLIKRFNIHKQRQHLLKLQNLLTALDAYETAIKKNKSFLQETNLLKSAAAVLEKFDKKVDFAQSLVTSIKNVIDLLYTLIRELEGRQIDEKFELFYEPIEDLQDCELFALPQQHIELKTIKDFFNIFAYVQSQMLLRFGLIILSRLDDATEILSTKFDVITAAIACETKSISQFLDIIEHSSSSRRSQRIHEIPSISSELREIRSESIRCSTKLLALAYKSQELENLITDFCTSPSVKADEIFERLNTMKNEISLSHDELERISILLQKYLNIELDDGKIPQEKIENLQNASNNDGNNVHVAEFSQPTDEFFFVDSRANDNEEEIKNRDDAIDEIDSKLAKRYFKPVLLQLRERIEVIGEDFKEREKKVLQAKGIDIDGMIDENDIKLNQSDDEDSGSDDERERLKRLKKNAEKFRENRDFLESKQQVNIFGLPPPPRFLLAQNFDEDVIE